MSIETNKTIVRRFFDEVLNQQSQAAAAQLIDPALVVHHPLLPGGIGGMRDVAQMMGNCADHRDLGQLGFAGVDAPDRRAGID